MKKSFVLDTNVLLHSATALTAFADNEVVLPIQVIEELDRFKKGNNDLARNARAVIRRLDRLRAKGRLSEGVPLDETDGTVRVCVTSPSVPPSAGLSPSLADNQILAVAYDLMKRGEPVVFVSKDINARIKSDALGIRTMDFEKQKVDFDRLYAGWRQIDVPGELIDRLHEAQRTTCCPTSLRCWWTRPIRSIPRWHGASRKRTSCSPSSTSARAPSASARATKNSTWRWSCSSTTGCSW
jgi:PhoH-like ATPase